MDMSRDEIVVRYRQAKHKAEQIKILAELNDCHVEDIIKILLDSGINLRGMNKIRDKIEKISAVQPENVPEPTVEEVEDVESKPIAESTPIDNAIDLIRKQVAEIDAEISVLVKRKQAIIDKIMKSIFTDGTAT